MIRRVNTPAPILDSVLTCPSCARTTLERMPEDYCLVRWTCPGCGAALKPKAGDCCVFCSYGSVPCPPVQAQGGKGAGSCC
jgi:ribosomal protein L37AE/L43A